MSGKTEQGGTVFQYRSVVDKTWRDCDEVDADAYGQTGCHEVRKLYTHAERASVPQEWRSLLANLASVVRVQNGNRHDDTNRLLGHADRLLAVTPHADTTVATP